MNDAMWDFFQRLEVIDEKGLPTQHFGDSLWVYLKYRIALKDTRPHAVIMEEGRQALKRVESRGVRIPSRTASTLDNEIRSIVEEARKNIWFKLTSEQISGIPNAYALNTTSKDRTEYTQHPPTGEKLASDSQALLKELGSNRLRTGQSYCVQIVVSDGLNIKSLENETHLLPYITELVRLLRVENISCAPEIIVVCGGRVRVGYRIGETLFSNKNAELVQHAIIHVIGERPGNGHNTFSAYITVSPHWLAGEIDHNITKVVSGISPTSLCPQDGAQCSVLLLKEMLCQMRRGSHL